MISKMSLKFFHNRVTFVGLGNMGYHMATNLIKSGIKVSSFDTNIETTEKFYNENKGDKYLKIEDAIKESDVLITMLPNAKSVKTVWEIAEKAAKKGTYFIDSSTISPLDSLEISKQNKEKGFIPADAPVSGGVMGAQKATLSFMVGTEKEHFSFIKKILTPMGKNIMYCGENSLGQVAKTCNNLCLGITMVGISEALAMGVKLGMDPKVMSEVMGVSSARCWSLDTYNPIPNVMQNVPSERNYENGFSMELINKDLNIALDCANKKGLDAELSKKALNHYAALKEKFPTKDFSYVYQYILNNKKI